MELENRSTIELVKLASNENDDDVRWRYIQILHQRGNKEVFDEAEILCKSDDSKKIALGADILGQLGTPKLPFKKESLSTLLNLTETNLRFSENDKDITAFQSVIFALGRMENKKARLRILDFKNHASEEIRLAVVHGISGIEEKPEIQALIKLSNDSDGDVRNWATFGLGNLIETNTQEIRDALFERLQEKIGDELCDEIRGEALLGLALRKDERVIEPLIKELSLKLVGTLSIEAAGEIADSRLCESLLRLQDTWDIDEEMLKETIKSCCKE
jgi:HEAT repeat protein